MTVGIAVIERVWRCSEHPEVDLQVALPSTCQHCGRVFPRTQLDGYIAHVRKHEEGATFYQCEHCDEAPFVTPAALKRHMTLSHPKLLASMAPLTTRAAYVCQECGGEVPEEYLLRSHMQAHASGRQIFKCPHWAAGCKRVFLTASGLQLHLRSKAQ